MEYCCENGRLTPTSIRSIIIAAQHDPHIGLKDIRETIIDNVVKKVCPQELFNEHT
jgi:S-adenosylmethionine synthetase